MKSRFLSECYGTSKGRILQEQEANFLQHSITVSCKQTILQIGDLGWEQRFIDTSLYQRFIVVDSHMVAAQHDVKAIKAMLSFLPVLSNSVDMVIMPHSLEFEEDQHQALREIERVLKPEGKLIILNFNPWSYWVRYRYLMMHGRDDPLMRKFIRRSKILDWLKLLNFEVDIVAGFRVSEVGKANRQYKKSPTVVSYAVKAIKRRYNVIPLNPGRVQSPAFAIAKMIESSSRVSNNE